MPHHLLQVFDCGYVCLRIFIIHTTCQMSSFKSIPGMPQDFYDEIIDTNTYLLARDEDCENAFHSTADFVSLNIFAG